MWKLATCLCAALLLVATPVGAQDPEDSAATNQPAAAAGTARTSAAYLGQPKDTYQVFVFGDSLAAGLFAGMARMADGDLRFSIDGRFKDDSGLARPEFYDWAAALPKVLERRNIDVAVIFLGANDGQDIRATTGPVAFRTPDWATTYAARIDSIVEILLEKGTAIYWIELPPMGPEPLEEEAKYIATIHRDRAVKAKIRFVQTRRAFADADDLYTDRGLDVDGKEARLRTRDGIHFLKAGNNRLGELILDAIRKDIDVADGKEAFKFVSPHDDAPYVSLPVAEARDKPRLPLFGQAAGSKQETDMTVMVGDPLWASAVLAIKAVAVDVAVGKSDSLETPFSALIELRRRVPPESSAGQLLINGQWPRVQTGRFDDFTWSSR